MAVLEISVTTKTRENMKKPANHDKKQVKKVLVVAQELKLARVLAGNNKTARDRALKSLKKWFQNRSTTIPFTEDDFLRIWKGLFYSMWMSDKPLIQEECAENIASLIHSLPTEAALLFYKCGIIILTNEWFGIDQLRLDKFLMFVRRLLRQALFVVKNENWNKDVNRKFSDVLSETILQPHSQKPLGLLLHFIEIFVEELAKVSEGELPPQLVPHFLSPFIKVLAFSDDYRIIDHIKKHIFLTLIKQSDLGLEYDEKYKVWRSLGFPNTIDSIKKVEISDEEDDNEEGYEIYEREKVLDPRAGRVDVSLPQIKFHSKTLIKALSEIKFEKDTNVKSRKCISELIDHFKKLSAGIYPLGIRKLNLAADNYNTNLKKAVNRLFKLDKKIHDKKKKKRKIETDEIELRGGKKIKLDNDFKTKLEQDFSKKLKKRKILETQDTPPSKQQRLEIESIFKRNSGTWHVTKIVKQNEETISNLKEDEVFPSNQWESSISDETTEKIENSLKKDRLSFPQNLIKNPFAHSSPVKKVKINTKLNQSQDMREHRQKILSSPAIPYDANKKPAKPLLKTPTKSSPINPFY